MAFPKGHKFGNRFSSTNQPKKKRSNPVNAVVVEFTKEQERKLQVIRSEVLDKMDEQDCTKHQLAKGTGLSYHTVNDFLKGLRTPTLETLGKIWKFLSIMENL